MPRPAAKLGPYRAVIDSWLVADRASSVTRPSRSINQRVVDEHGADARAFDARELIRRVAEREDVERRNLSPAAPVSAADRGLQEAWCRASTAFRRRGEQEHAQRDPAAG
jgi:hypothetical protein